MGKIRKIREHPAVLYRPVARIQKFGSIGAIDMFKGLATKTPICLIDNPLLLGARYRHELSCESRQQNILVLKFCQRLSSEICNASVKSFEKTETLNIFLTGELPSSKSQRLWGQFM
jgi:hypothetical protein